MERQISAKVGAKAEAVARNQISHYLVQKGHKALLVCHGNKHGQLKIAGAWRDPIKTVQSLSRSTLRKEVTKLFVLCCNSKALQPFEIGGIRVRPMFPNTSRVGVKRRGNRFFLRTVAL